MKRTLIVIFGLSMIFSFSYISIAADFNGTKNVFSDSPTEGYAWSDSQGAEEAVATSGVELKIQRLDIEINTSDEFNNQTSHNAKSLAVWSETTPSIRNPTWVRWSSSSNL